MRFFRLLHRKRGIIAAAYLLLVCAVAWVAGAIVRARQAAAESACDGRMCGHGMALGSYYSANHTYPPEFLIDANKKRIFWEGLLARFEGGKLDLSCPTGAGRFVGVVGREAILGGSQPATPTDVSDGCDNTLVLIELNLNELTLAEGASIRVELLERFANTEAMFPTTSIHPRGRGMLFADCTAYRQLKPIPIRDMRALCTKAGGEGETRQKLVDAGCLVHVGWYPQIP